MPIGCEINANTQKVNGKEVKLVMVRGFLDAHSFPVFEKELNALIEQGSNNMVLNLSGLDYISSAGLGVLIGVAKKLRVNQGDLKLSALPEKIYKIVNLLGFTRILQVFDNDQDAINSFKA